MTRVYSPLTLPLVASIDLERTLMLRSMVEQMSNWIRLSRQIDSELIRALQGLLSEVDPATDLLSMSRKLLRLILLDWISF
jgi:hypothetical protein